MGFLRELFLGLLLLVGVSSCALFEAEIEPCGYSCGPCELGQWSCESGSCELGHLEGVLSESDSCNDVSFVANDAPSKERGTMQEPFSTFAQAISTKSKVILVKKGRFETDLKINRSVHIFGGMLVNSFGKWVKSAERTIIVSAKPTLNIINTDNVVVSGFTFKSLHSSLQLGGQLISSKNIVIQDSSFEFEPVVKYDSTNSGRAGERGSDGELGSLSSNAGVGGTNLDCPAANGANGGEGRTNIGSPKRGGSTGTNIGGNVGENGEVGEKGVNGDTGENGTWTGSDGVLVLIEPLAGIPGSIGFGGAGGGGSPDQTGESSRGGSGGGAGGCGGEAGEAGTNGDFIVGLTFFESSVDLEDSTLLMVNAGNGVPGGLGGDGGRGGTGGIFRDGAGAGGDGGNGGDGGSGGAGLRGQSIPFVCFGELSKVIKKNVIIEKKKNGEGYEGNNLPNCD